MGRGPQPLPHHQLCEDDVQLLGGGPGQGGLQGHHVGRVIMAVGDLWLVASFEAAREKRRQAPPLMLLYPRNHGDLLLKHRRKQQKCKHVQHSFYTSKVMIVMLTELHISAVPE